MASGQKRSRSKSPGPRSPGPVPTDLANPALAIIKTADQLLEVVETTTREFPRDRRRVGAAPVAVGDVFTGILKDDNKQARTLSYCRDLLFPAPPGPSTDAAILNLALSDAFGRMHNKPGKYGCAASAAFHCARVIPCSTFLLSPLLAIALLSWLLGMPHLGLGKQDMIDALVLARQLPPTSKMLLALHNEPAPGALAPAPAGALGAPPLGLGAPSVTFAPVDVAMSSAKDLEIARLVQLNELLLDRAQADKRIMELTSAAEAKSSSPGASGTTPSPDSIHRSAWEKNIVRATHRITNYQSLGHPAGLSEAMRKKERLKPASQAVGAISIQGNTLHALNPEGPLDAASTKELGFYPFLDGFLHAISIGLKAGMPEEYVLDRINFLRWVVHAPYTTNSKVNLALNIDLEYEGAGVLFMDAVRSDNRLSNDHLVKLPGSGAGEGSSSSNRSNNRSHSSNRSSASPSRHGGNNNNHNNGNNNNNNNNKRGNSSRNTSSGRGRDQQQSANPAFVRKSAICKGCSDPTFICKGVGNCPFSHKCSKCDKGHALNWCDAP
jgi:hypothetical protein